MYIYKLAYPYFSYKYTLQFLKIDGLTLKFVIPCIVKLSVYIMK